MVTSNVAPYSIVAGNPAKHIKMRFSQEEISTLETLRWWTWDEEKLDSAMPYLLQGDVSALQTFAMKYDQP